MRNPILAGAICWVATLEFFIAQFAAQAAWPQYGFQNNDISLLGVTVCGIPNPAPAGIAEVCSPLNPVFNAGLALVGVLIVADTWLTRSAWPQRRLARIGLWLLALGGVGGALAGLFPLNVNLAAHASGALVNFVFGNAAIVLLGLATRRRHPRFGAYSMLTGAVCLVGVVLYLSGINGGIGRGIFERLGVFPQTTWFIVTGLLLLRGQRFGVQAAD